MEPLDENLFERLFFVVCSALIATILVITAIKLDPAKIKLPAIDSSPVVKSLLKTFSDQLSKVNQSVAFGLSTIAFANKQSSSMTPSAISLSTYLKPADHSSLPAIPIAEAKLASQPPLASQSAVQLVATTNPIPPPVSQTVAALAKPASPSLDLYAPGNCTWWAAKQRSDIGDPIPNTWGNATAWATLAAADGYQVDHHPSAGAIMVLPGVDYGLGHVAFVESVEPDGTWHISEMNVIGYGLVDYRSRPASAASYYYFIHDKIS